MAQGSAEALSELFARRAGLVLAFLVNHGFPTETAEDAVQETFLAAWKTASRFHQGNTTGWLLRIAVCRAVDLERAHRRTRTLADRAARDGLAADAAVAPSAEDCLIASSAHYTALGAALADLPARQRLVMELRYIHQLTVAQTARHLDVPEGTVKAWAFRGRERMRTRLREQTEEVHEDATGNGDRNGGDDDDGVRGATGATP
ncbi:sigma-70 family RNA polymerase sigma factor [Streptomyces sp. NBC_01485]|uniref:RNA polymerase sigma factor n=1 Tax=Streptomyces sp. NBC_01485 TaxID=2903884 RepID=UPI002E36F2EC|nr:sigma-70 family RNA polymerase sigma factor [Streptomyces sp. NBC_01485]